MAKAQKDRVKLILEGKEALNTSFKIIGKYVPDIEVYVLQIAGLKGHLIAHNINDRIRFPIANNDIYDQTALLFKSMMKFKVRMRNVHIGFKYKVIKRLTLGKMLDYEE